MESTFHDWAGAGWANWLFMLGLLGVGIALVSGVTWGLGKLWTTLPIVRDHNWLK
ncbi:thiosulfate dehydrogenase [quinone] large subunit [Streptomyces sp. yr375]|nr:thiosulfate dehydrogenase [quinone] large subunit [Streptomyces sp. yr375]